MKILLPILFITCLTILASDKEPLEIGSNGHPIIHVNITGSNGITRTALFVLDTGSNITVLNKDLINIFSKQTHHDAMLTGGRKESIKAEEIKIHAISFGNIKLSNISAIAMNLDDTIGAVFDEHLDGILGMNVLRGLRFTLDFKNGLIEWNSNAPKDIYERRLHYSSRGLPLLDVNFNNKKVEMLCDTGSMSLMQLPQGIIDNKEIEISSEKRLGIGISGSVNRDKSGIFNGLANTGRMGWFKPSVNILAPGDTAILGIHAFGTRVWFDFIDNLIGFTLTNDKFLSTTPPIRCPIAAMWKMIADTRCLVVLAVKPNSPYEISGIKSGDQLIKIDNLEKATLTIKGVQSDLASRTIHTIILKRKDKIISLTIDDHL